MTLCTPLPRPGQKFLAFTRVAEVGSKNGHKNFGQARFCYFRDKCVVFARSCKIANLIQYRMQYTMQ